MSLYIQPGNFRYGLKLFDGKYLYGEGESWQLAACAAGVKASSVKRFMPIVWLDKWDIIQEASKRSRTLKNASVST